MTQSAKYMLCKHADLRVIPQKPHESQALGPCTSNMGAEEAEKDTYVGGCWLASVPESDSSMFSERSCVKKKKKRNAVKGNKRKYLTLTSGLHMHVAVCRHVDLYICVHTHKHIHRDLQLCKILNQLNGMGRCFSALFSSFWENAA